MSFKPKKYLGQNFLQDEEVLEAIITAADLKSTDTVLEVGPGRGVLTRELIKHAKEVIAVEKDSSLLGPLKLEFDQIKNIKIINDDILKFHLEKNLPTDYKVVANIPYYLTSKLFQYFLESSHQPKLLILMVQKEVGERVVASPGELSILGISVQIYSDVEIIRHVSKESFWPVPEVDSVILRIIPKNKYPEIDDKKLFFRIIKMAFAGKRKQLQNSLANGLKLPKEKILDYLTKAQINPVMRPQDLSIEDWIRLFSVFK